MIARQLLCAAIFVGAAFGGASLQAATTTYTYDALGRLRVVEYDTGKVAIYDYDSAGNRTRVVTGTMPSAPSSIAVPKTGTTGNYKISWGTAAGTVTAYQLFQATNTSFTDEKLVYTGSAKSYAISGRASGTYYYRVRACLSSHCEAALAGSNGVVVTRP